LYWRVKSNSFIYFIFYNWVFLISNKFFVIHLIFVTIIEKLFLEEQKLDHNFYSFFFKNEHNKSKSIITGIS